MNAVRRYRVAAVLGVVAVALLATAARAQSAPGDDRRGRLLYENHCIECHNAQVHWRDKRLATNWESLKAWVRHWQGAARLRWSDEDVGDVTRHLNRTIYRFPEPRAGA